MKKTLNGFISFRKNAWDDGGFHWHPYEMAEHGYITVMPHSIEVDIPDDFDPRPQQIKALEEKQRAAGAAFAALTTEINRQISELQALEFTPEVAS